LGAEQLKISPLVVEGRPTILLRASLGIAGELLGLCVLAIAAVEQVGFSVALAKPLLIMFLIAVLMAPVVVMVGEKFMWPWILSAYSGEDNENRD
jgi:Na+/serine symporter